MDGPAPHWFKSSYSGFAEHCVEVGFTGLPSVLLRDDRYRGGAVLRCGPGEWSGLMRLLASE